MIVVTSGCQSAGVAAALGGMLPDRLVAPVVPLSGQASEFAATLAEAEVWVTSLDGDDLAAARRHLRPSARVVRIPNLYFHGFHPDILHALTPEGGRLGSAASEYSSAIIVAGWQLGLGAEQIRRCFAGAVYDRLGYGDAWVQAMAIARERFAASDLDFGDWYLPLARRGTFMLNDNHPTVAALAQLARQVGRLLGADPELIAFPWADVVPDGLLATSSVWPVYPELAQRLGVPGGYVWRGDDGVLRGLGDFIEATLDQYRALDPANVVVDRFADGHTHAVIMDAALELEVVG